MSFKPVEERLHTSVLTQLLAINDSNWLSLASVNGAVESSTTDIAKHFTHNHMPSS